MAQEFTIKSQDIEDKINQLLPSQGGFGAGVDFSASTMVIPIVDLTETAEGSALRQDLQLALTHTNATTTQIATATDQVLVTTTGFYLVRLSFYNLFSATNVQIKINDGTTKKVVAQYTGLASGSNYMANPVVDSFIIKLEAGDSLEANSGNASNILNITTRQVADINGNLITP